MSKCTSVLCVGVRSRSRSCIISSISIGSVQIESNRIKIVCQSMLYRLEPYYIRWFFVELERNSIPAQVPMFASPPACLPPCMPIVDSKRFDLLLYIELTVNNERSFNNVGCRCVRCEKDRVRETGPKCIWVIVSTCCVEARKMHVDLLMYDVNNICYRAHTMITSIYYSILLDFQVVLWRPHWTYSVLTHNRRLINCATANIKIGIIFIWFAHFRKLFEWISRFCGVISNVPRKSCPKLRARSIDIGSWTWAFSLRRKIH